MKSNLTEEEKKQRIKDYQKQWREKNKEYFKEYQKEYNKSHNYKEYQKQWYEKNKDYKKAYRKEWCKNNKDYKKEYEKNKRNEDPTYKLKHNIRTYISKLFQNNGYKKGSKTEVILGCSFEDFKQHIESQFEPWMNWDNYGNWNGIPTEENTAWDIDHIIPVSIAVTEDELIKLNHYSNLRPFCSYTNRFIKRNSINFFYN